MKITRQQLRKLIEANTNLKKDKSGKSIYPYSRLDLKHGAPGRSTEQGSVIKPALVKRGDEFVPDYVAPVEAPLEDPRKSDFDMSDENKAKLLELKFLINLKEILTQKYIKKMSNLLILES